jgi:hypothetical protein
VLSDLAGAAQLCASGNPAAGVQFGHDADQSQHSSRVKMDHIEL